VTVLHHWLFQTVWAAFWVYWWVVSRRVEKTKRVQSGFARLLYLVLVYFGFALMAVPAFHAGLLGQRLLPATETGFFAGALLLLVGLGFAVWARVHLGRYWSGTITLKEGHRLIRSGPYALVRHPIYTGILCAVLGTAIAQGEVRSALAFTGLAMLHHFKSRREERWLEEEFGEEYRQYHENVPALVPFLL
jgi:protein-S-isoprenylcysteine O-methyltransferase Ste14